MGLYLEQGSLCRQVIELDDFIGLKIIAGRIINYCIKLLFYLEQKYIPYSKWIGSAFKNLNAYNKAGPLVEQTLTENNPNQIETKLCSLYEFIVEQHNKNENLPHLDNKIRDFFGRPYKVIFAEKIIEKLKTSIENNDVKKKDTKKYAPDLILDH